MSDASRLNIPNILTLARIVAVPAVVLLLLPGGGHRMISPESSIAAFLIFVCAAITDAFDGFIARRYHMITDLGKLLDPLADKLLVCAAMIMLIPAERVPAWMAVIVVAREIGVTALRGVASTEGLVIAASKLGKWKTILLNIGVAMLILHYPFLGLPVHEMGYWVLLAGLVLTAWSGLDYFFRFVGEIFKH
jgi:CDP-diacylglycerol--glycerol-3-phosphate 3-phosphatidyltransferase